MAKRHGVKSVMVELNRFGEPGAVLQRGTRYIRTSGYDVPACEIEVGISYRDFERSLNTLRYVGATAQEVSDALDTFEREADKMLGDVPEETEKTIQIDLVTGASELWAFPFEACMRAKRVVLTRRIRGNCHEHVEWPSVPKVLFVHAAISADLPRELIDEHIAGLQDALRPWMDGADPIGKLLFVKEIYSLKNLEQARKGDYTHIHLLAHGISVPVRLESPVWGIRLGPVGAEGVHPDEIAAALSPQNGLPVTITVASCDSANQANAATASWSVAQELHRRGVPVVIASQLPLTTCGSVLLAKHFYEPLLCGEDVRIALDKVREALRNDPEACHDWLSLVTYVRLPENYEEHLDQVALKMELAMLRAAQRHADEVIRGKDDPSALVEIERRIQKRIDSLATRLQLLKEGKDRLECQGLLASAYKRLAELLFLGKRAHAEQRQALQTALEHYGEAFKSNLHMHWQGVQLLALQAVLHGSVDPIDYAIVMRGAKLSAERDPTDYWPLGTIAELYLIAAIAGLQTNQDEARAALENFKRLAAGNPEAIDTTRRQLRRYVDWWTKANGFQTDLAEQGAALAAFLTEGNPT